MKRKLQGCMLLLALAFASGTAIGLQEINPYEMFQQREPDSALTIDQLETALERLGLKPVTDSADSGDQFLTVVCNDGYADLDVNFSMSGDKKKILMSTALVVDLDVERIRPAQWAALLCTANSHRADNFYLQESPFLLGLRRSFDNRAVSAEVVKTEIESMMANIVQFRPAWEPIWEMAVQKPDSATTGTSTGVSAVQASSFVTQRPSYLFPKPGNDDATDGLAINKAIELWKFKYHEANEIIGGVWKETDSEGKVIDWEFFENGRARWSKTAPDGSVAGANFGFELTGSTITTSFDGQKSCFELEWIDGETVHLIDKAGQHFVFKRQVVAGSDKTTPETRN